MEERCYRWHRQREHKPTRYYELRIRKDLLGRWTITRAWGRCGMKLGRVVHYVIEEQAIEGVVIDTTRRRRQQIRQPLSRVVGPDDLSPAVVI